MVVYSDPQRCLTQIILWQALVDELKQLAFLNKNELVLVHSSSTTPALASSTTSLGIPSLSANLDAHHDGISVIDQGGLEHLRDFNLSDSASYPCTVEDGYLQGDDSTAQSDQPVQVFAPAALWSSDSASAFIPESRAPSQRP